MPDSRDHRGPDPRDPAAFAPEEWPRLRQAVADLSWLLTRGYAPVSSLKLVGDRHELTERQRTAVRRCACGDASLARRLRHRADGADLRGRPIRIDGFNVLTTVEVALGGGVVLRGRDGSDRDLAGVHGTYRRVEETRPALAVLAAVLAALGCSPCTWYLDRPVSNSGRLGAIVREQAAALGLDWRVELVFDPDPILCDSHEAVATADSMILDRCDRWFPLARHAVESSVPGAFLVDLAPPSPTAGQSGTRAAGETGP